MIKQFSDLSKGLSASQQLDTDFFDVATNVAYDRDRRLRSRNGYRAFGAPVPDGAVTLDLLDATTGWSASDDANTVAAGAALRGTASLSFAITPTAARKATLTKTTLSASIAAAKGAVGLFVKVPAGFNTGLTAVKLRLGSDASNFYEWTFPGLTEGKQQYVWLAFADAAATGTPDDAAISYARLQATYDGTFTAKAGILIDDLRAYSATSNSPVTSLFSHLRDDTLQPYLVAASGTCLWSYEPSGFWSLVASGLAEFETLWPDARTRWSFCVYKNVLYGCDGVNPYCSWDGIAFAQHAAQPKVRFLRYMADRVFGAGDDANPQTVYYTASLPANAQALNANSGVVGGDEQGRIQGLKDLGDSVLCAKDRKIYSVAYSTFAATPIDTRNGILSHRSIQLVGNGMLYFNDSGVDQLNRRVGVTGAASLEASPVGDEIYRLFAGMSGRFCDRQAVFGFYSPSLKNYYLGFPTSGNIPDTFLVFSALVGAWTRYDLPSAYDMAEYRDGDGTPYLLLAPAAGGQVLQLEYGFSDNGQEFSCALTSKRRDFGTPGVMKSVDFADFIGYKSPGDPLSVTLEMDGITVASGEVTDDMLDESAGPVSFALGMAPLATYPVGGVQGSKEITLETFPFVIRVPCYANGYALRWTVASDSSFVAWSLQKVRVSVESEQVDLISSSSLA